MDVDKAALRKEFSQQWQKHYTLEILQERGYTRQQCSSCQRAFWALDERKQCGDPSCVGYQFIGDSPCKKKLGYIDTWKSIEKYFTKNGHGYVKPYPTVARWRDDLYFTIASINDFQPYVVNGELDPPANPLIVPQPCIRFGDIANVGISGRHYTNFVMIGQHAFNKQKLFYWKNEAIEHDIGYLKMLGIPEKEIVFMEDVWAGGGNFGPSIEYFVRGLELGNCVFMQYEVTPEGNRELKTKVIDMGAGLNRLAWITTGDPTSYEVVLGKVIGDMKKQSGLKVDHGLLLRYAKISGSLNEDEVSDLEMEKARVAKMLGMGKEELFKTLGPLQALYAMADHTLTLLFAVSDGMLPSNAGGGYNLRMVLRRVFGFEEEFGLRLDMAKVLENHAAHLRYLFPHLTEGVATTAAVIEEERKRYVATKQKAEGIVLTLVKKAKGSENAPLKERDAPAKTRIDAAQLFTLYKSYGIPPEHMVEVAKVNGVEVAMPGNFYQRVKEKEENVGKKTVSRPYISRYPKTKGLYYTDTATFHAKVLGVEEKYVILDQSAFYPEGGGQVADTGTLDGVAVVDVQKEGGVMLLDVGAAAKRFTKGKRVEGTVNLERRKAITRHHTATHLVTAACREILGSHAWQGGSYKDEHKAHVDITHYRRMSNEELQRIERRVNEYILANMPIVVNILPRNEAEEKYGFILYQGGAVPGKELRVVSIGDVDHEACGGTHHMLRHTGELGAFKLVKRESVQDGIERLTYKAGLAALAYMQEREALIANAAGIVSVAPNELPATVERFFTEWKEQKKKIERLSEQLVQEEAKEIIGHGTEKPVVKIVDVDAASLRKLGDMVAQSDGAMAVLMNPHGNVVCAAGKNAKTKANELLKMVLAKLGGNGGGSATLAQGKVKRVDKVELG